MVLPSTERLVNINLCLFVPFSAVITFPNSCVVIFDVLASITRNIVTTLPFLHKEIRS